MRMRNLLGASMLAMAVATPAWAQEAPQAETASPTFGSDIVVTAQRQTQRLQDVPIAVSAFSAESLESQQIENSSDLQLTLPNVTFTRTNFSGASFTIRGIGDLCVGVTCDSATGIHMNDRPLLGSRLFETEFFDIERIEVLRGPQGTLYGRNATSGVVNIVTAVPNLSEFQASAEFEYGNFDSMEARGMVNVPIGDIAALRLAGYYQQRDGYTENLFNGARLDDRDMYAVRASLRIEPSDRTTIDLVGYYFRENDNRMRIQHQYCQRDPTGVLGCLNANRGAEFINANATFGATLTSREMMALTLGSTALGNLFGLGSVYGPDTYTGINNPADPRQVYTDHTPTFFADELVFQASIEQNFGNFNVSLAGNYQRSRTDNSQDYNLSVANRAIYAQGLNGLAAAAAGLIPGLPAAYFAPIANAIIPNGPNGPICTSLAEETGTGTFGGFRTCNATPMDFDRSVSDVENWSIEGIVSSDFDGPFNFIIGANYLDLGGNNGDYYVNAVTLDYLTGILGSFTALGAGLPPAYLGSPFFRSNSQRFELQSYGIFGEAYYNFTDNLKLTLGLRYNHDEKYVRARTTLASWLVPYNSTDIATSPYIGSFDADAARPGNQLFQERNVTFSEWTGRAVLDWQITPDNLLYFSYARGYKSGGINPPISPIFAVPDGFDPEFVNAFEIGSKNTFGNLQLNITGFFYQYDSLQLSRIIARTSVNDNVNAEIYGLEIEAIMRPVEDVLINVGFSYLHTAVSEDRFQSNPRDPGGGRADVVIIKDLSNGANCAVVPTVAGNAAGANGYVAAINAALGGSVGNAGLIRAPVAFPAGSGINSTGAYSLCSVLTSSAATVGALFGGVQVLSPGVDVNIRGNELPQAPNFKFSIGAQYTHEFNNGMTLVPRVDLAYTGDSYGNIFNGEVNEIDGYAQVNAQIQLNGNEDRWFARAFVQNIFDSNAETGLYLTDASSGNFSNIFTLEPRRYGIAVGFRF